MHNFKQTWNRFECIREKDQETHDSDSYLDHTQLVSFHIPDEQSPSGNAITTHIMHDLSNAYEHMGRWKRG